VHVAKKGTVLVGLSGGIDSAFAALKLKEEGYDVCGVHFVLPSYKGDSEKKILQAKRLADRIGISIIIHDSTTIFHKEVIEYFIDSYKAGLTPNPCVRCNQRVKFNLLLQIANKNGFDFIATGHYARIRAKDGFFYLLKGRGKKKEQSYFLSMLEQEILKRCLFPLGEYSKDDLLLEASKLKLIPNSYQESQEVCFLAGRDYRELLKDLMADQGAGRIRDIDGNVLGTHNGIYNYTIGQRKGIGIAKGHPLYVKEISIKDNEVIVAPKEFILEREVRLQDPIWHLPDKLGKKKLWLEGQIRYKQKCSRGFLEMSLDGFRFTFEEPQWAITPGQVFVGYRCDLMVISGWIAR